MENLLADQRTTEAHDVLNKYKCIPSHQEKTCAEMEIRMRTNYETTCETDRLLIRHFLLDDAEMCMESCQFRKIYH